MGADFFSKRIRIEGTDVVLQVWDTAGMERFHNDSLGDAFYRGAHGALLVYDVTNEKSMEQLVSWHEELISRRRPEDMYSSKFKIASTFKHPETLTTDSPGSVSDDILQLAISNGN